MSAPDVVGAVADARRAAQEARAAADAAIAAVRTSLTRDLRERRQALGMTQQQVADAAGISRVSVANIDTDRQLSVESLIGYAAAVGLTLRLTPEGAA